MNKELMSAWGEWHEYAACLNQDNRLFFPEPGHDGHAAKIICRTCAVMDDCLEYAMTTNQEFGIWGATTPNQRKALKRKRQRERKKARESM